jgi:FAD/FMN-containing dehydrogenase
MNQISDFNEADQTVLVGAGVVTEVLQNYAKEKGFHYPVDFAAKGSSQIGGNIATNAGGIKVLRYGMTREWIAGLTVVTGAGEIIQTGNGLIKNATGYDFRHLFIGSEGTLGFITQAVVKLAPPPPPLRVMILAAPDLPSIMQVYSVFKKTTQLSASIAFHSAANVCPPLG